MSHSLTIEQVLRDKGFKHEPDYDRWVRAGEGGKPIYVSHTVIDSMPDEELVKVIEKQIAGEPWTANPGDPVTFVDERGVPRPALLTRIFGPTSWTRDYEAPCVNLVFVSGDESRSDDYGRQTERRTSIVHRTSQYAHGSYWTR